MAPISQPSPHAPSLPWDPLTLHLHLWGPRQPPSPYTRVAFPTPPTPIPGTTPQQPLHTVPPSLEFSEAPLPCPPFTGPSATLSPYTPNFWVPYQPLHPVPQILRTLVDPSLETPPPSTIYPMPLFLGCRAAPSLHARNSNLPLSSHLAAAQPRVVLDPLEGGGAQQAAPSTPAPASRGPRSRAAAMHIPESLQDLANSEAVQFLKRPKTITRIFAGVRPSRGDPTAPRVTGHSVVGAGVGGKEAARWGQQSKRQLVTSHPATGPVLP